MIRELFDKDTVLIDLNELDNLFTKNNINLTKEDTVSLFKNIYCCTTLKCKKRKGKLCMEKINKKNKNCKIHKNSNTYDCISRCNSPNLENNDNIFSNSEFSNKYDKNNNYNYNNNIHQYITDENNNYYEFREELKCKSKFNNEDLENNSKNIGDNKNIDEDNVKNNLQKIDKSNIIQILELYIKTFSIYLINTNIEEIVKNNFNNYYVNFIENILYIIEDLIEKTPLLLKIILFYDYTVLYKYIEENDTLF